MVDKYGAFSNPYDHREMMKAVFGWIDKTPDEVAAEQDARAKKDQPRSKKGPKPAPSGPPSLGPAPPKSEVEKMKALLGRNHPKKDAAE